MNGVYLALLLIPICSQAAAPSNGASCDLLQGGIGKIRIDQSLRRVEQILQKKITLDFLGDGQGGLSIESKRDLHRMNLPKAPKMSVLGADVIFNTTKSSRPTIKTISFLVSCEDVEQWQRVCGGTSREVTSGKRELSWLRRSDNGTFTVGGSKNPCQITIRKN